MEKFIDVFPDIHTLNGWRLTLYGNVHSTPLSNEEWIALVGRFAASTIRYNNRTQFMCAFFTILQESQEKLRVKLRANNTLRNLTSEEALDGDEVITNNAANPDQEPSTDSYKPLPYINSQVAQKGKLSKVRGLYDWKHSVGGQAYNEFLDSFRPLFRVVLSKEETAYEQ